MKKRVHQPLLRAGNWIEEHKYVSRYPVDSFNKEQEKPCRNMGFNLMGMYVTSMGPRRLSAISRSHCIWPLTHIEKEVGPVPFFPFFFFPFFFQAYPIKRIQKIRVGSQEARLTGPFLLM